MDAARAAHLARHDAQSDVADRRLRAWLEPLELSGDRASCIEGCHGSGIAIWLIIALERPHLMHEPEERIPGLRIRELAVELVWVVLCAALLIVLIVLIVLLGCPREPLAAEVSCVAWLRC